MGSRMLSQYNKLGSEDVYRQSLESNEKANSMSATMQFFHDYTYGPVIDTFSTVSEYCRSTTLLSYPWNVGSVYASAMLDYATFLSTANLAWNAVSFLNQTFTIIKARKCMKM